MQSSDNIKVVITSVDVVNPPQDGINVGNANAITNCIGNAKAITNCVGNMNVFMNRVGKTLSQYVPINKVALGRMQVGSVNDRVGQVVGVREIKQDF